MKRLYFISFFFFFVFKAFSQDYIDSLDQLQNNRNRDSLYFEKLYSYANHIYLSHPDTTLYYLDNSIINTADTSEFRGVGLSYLMKGWILKEQGNYNDALLANDSALFYFEPIKFNAGISAVFNNKGIVYKQQRNYKKALDSYMKSLSVKKEYADSTQLLSTLNNIGLVYYHLQEYNLAEYYYKRNLKIAKANNLLYKQSIAYNNLGNLKFRQDQFNEALQYYLKSDSALKPGVDNFLKSTLIGNIALSYEELGSQDKAKEYFQQAIQLSRDIGDFKTKVLALRGLMRISFDRGNFEQANYYKDEAWKMCKEKKDYWTLSAISNELFQVYKSRGNYKKGLYYMEKFHEYYDSTHNIEKSKEIHRLKEKFESEQKAQRIKLLEKENKLKQTQLEKEQEAQARKRLQILFLIGLAVLTIGAAFYLWRRNIAKRRLNEKLREQNEMIKEQREEIQIQNEELAKSNQLKDKMFQIISHDLRSPLIALDDTARVISYCIEDNDYKTIDELSDTLATSVSRILALIDNLLSWSMSQHGEIPYNPEKLNLNEVAQEITDIYQNLAQMKNIELVNTIDPAVRVYADKNILMTVLRNLVNNAIKFTPDEGNVKIGAMKHNNEVQVWIEDNGIGMDKEKLDQVFSLDQNKSAGTRGEGGNGLGMFFSKEFVKINKGDIKVQSEKGKGTVVVFTLPAMSSLVNV